jgi:hypothetical protein
MNAKQKAQIDYYIGKLDKAVEIYTDSGEPSELYDLCEQIQAIYSSEIHGIDDQYDKICNYSGLIERCSRAISALLKNYVISNYNPIEKELVNNTRNSLLCCPIALEQYDSALTKYESGTFERNTLDDMRLSFELLLKYLLSNNKSLENQISVLGEKLKELNASVELRNMLNTVIDYYNKYQNGHVKHKDAVNPNEIEFIIELTSVIMKFLIKTLA